MLRKCFEVKQIAQNKVLEIYLYGEIRTDWYDWWNGQVVESTTSANYVRKAVSEAGDVDEIKVYINSDGFITYAKPMSMKGTEDEELCTIIENIKSHFI